MKHLYFVRHGESLHNTLGVASGYTDSPLTDKGKAQAAEAGRTAREAGLVFDVVLSSPLQRAHHTAKEIATHVEYPHESIVLLDELKERFFGDLEEKTFGHFEINSEMYTENPFVLDHIPNIEKLADLQYRANQALAYLKSLPYDSILVVSHGAFGRALRRAAENAPISEEGQGRYLDNTQIIKLL